MFSHPTRTVEGMEFTYEERITLWLANSMVEAATKGAIEARQYANEAKAEFIKVTNVFNLFDEKLAEGVEVWGYMRTSNLKPEVYLKNYLSTENDAAGEICNYDDI
jgi:hypothetical protein